MKRFLLGRELPAVFTLALVGAALAFRNAQPAFGGWLFAAALWCLILWLILLPARTKRATRTEIEQRHKRGQQQQHCKRGRRTA